MLSIFYTRKEIATRISILYTGNILATAFAGLIAAGVFAGMDDLAGLAGWQWLFILQGAVTFVVAVSAAFILPDDPLKTKWLTPEERELAHNRIQADTVGAKSQTSTFKGLKEAARDPKVSICVKTTGHKSAILSSRYLEMLGRRLHNWCRNLEKVLHTDLP